jgi:hypothetical protein
MRIKDVYYWYIDYRDFADVVKYRIAMMRKGIDEKVKEVSPLFWPLRCFDLILTTIGDWCEGIYLSEMSPRI